MTTIQRSPALPVWSELKPPVWLKFRSSKRLIGFTAFVAAFTDGFLYTIVVPVLPYSLVDRSGVPEKDVQFWHSTLLIVFGITMALGAPVAGWAADRSSSRQLPFLAGLGLAFTATICFCVGRAPWLLIIARAFQGFSASIIYTAGLALIADTVNPDEVGSWMGFVLSGMNLGALIGPFLSGFVYERAGYYAVFAVGLGVIGFDFILRVIMVEKRNAAKWFEKERHDDEQWVEEGTQGESDSTASDDYYTSTKSDASSTQQGSERPDQPPSEPDETSSLLPRTTQSGKSWFARAFPTMAILLSSPRLRASVYGCFTHTVLIASFDAVLPLFVKRTFHWTSTGAGLIFLAITVPSLLGTIIGALSDRYGPRNVALFGFALTTPSLALMGIVTKDSMSDKVLLSVFLVLIGIGLNLILAPLAADLFYEVEVLAEDHPGVFGQLGAFAQAYSIFDAALGLATAVGPGWSGFFFEQTDWQITAGTLAALCAIGGIPVFYYTGGRIKKKGKIIGEFNEA